MVQNCNHCRPGMTKRGKQVLLLSMSLVCLLLVVFLSADGNPFHNGTRSQVLVNSQDVILNEIGGNCIKTVVSVSSVASDYIELYNRSLFDCKLEGLYLSDDENDLKKHPIPDRVLEGGAYLVISLYEGGFGISKEGGERILLSDSQGRILDSVTTECFYADYGYSRDGNNQWVMMTATPGKANDGLCKGALLPTLSHESGFYQEEFLLTINADKDCTVYYTLDGSIPTTKSRKYSEPIRVYNRSDEPNVFRSEQRVVPKWWDYTPNTKKVDKAFIVRAVAVSADGKVSEPVCGMYFVDLEQYQNQQVVSLVVDPSEMWGINGIGVTGMAYDLWYEQGAKGTAPTTNFRQKGRQWEIGADFFFCSEDMQFQQPIGLRVNGGSARDGAFKRYSLFARTDYSGTEYFARELIAGVQSSSLVLREDLATVICQMLVRDRAVATQQATPVTVFINGEYWYDTHLIEKYNDTYFQQHYGIAPENIIVAKKGQLEEGEETDILFWETAEDFLSSHDMTKPESYDQLGQLVDLQSYIDFLAANLYIDNLDFDDYKNVVVWKARQPADSAYADGRWRFAMYDLDAIEWNDYKKFDVSCQAEKNPFQVKWRFATSLQDHTLYKNLKPNAQFRQQFVTTFMDLVNTSFTYDNVQSAFMQYTREAPNQFFEDFFRERPQYMTQYLAQEFELTGTVETLTVSVSDSDAGAITVNTVTPKLQKNRWFGKYFTDFPVTVTAEAKEGYRFVGWEGQETKENTLTVYLQEGGVKLHAIFEKTE